MARRRPWQKRRDRQLTRYERARSALAIYVSRAVLANGNLDGIRLLPELDALMDFRAVVEPFIDRLLTEETMVVTEDIVAAFDTAWGVWSDGSARDGGDAA